MGLAVLDMSMSVDGFVSGPKDDDPNKPGGDGFMLHDWAFTPEGGIKESEPANELMGQIFAAGAVVSGRRTAEHAASRTRWRRPRQPPATGACT